MRNLQASIRLLQSRISLSGSISHIWQLSGGCGNMNHSSVGAEKTCE